MKVVKHKITGEIVYKSIPDFEKGKGIINACIFNKQYKSEDLEEVEISQLELDTINKIKIDKLNQENKIKEEEKRILREQAINNLRARGEII